MTRLWILKTATVTANAVLIVLFVSMAFAGETVTPDETGQMDQADPKFDPENMTPNQREAACYGFIEGAIMVLNLNKLGVTDVAEVLKIVVNYNIFNFTYEEIEFQTRLHLERREKKLKETK